jgi:hypothetical protein
MRSSSSQPVPADQAAEDKRENELTLADVIIPAKEKFKIDVTSTSDLSAAILEEFNRGVSKVVTESFYRGERIKAEEVLMVRRNGVQELAVQGSYYLALPLFNWIDDINRIGVYKVTAIYYGGKGYKKHVVNVPAGKYFRAWSGNNPILLGPGTHVIKDTFFRPDVEILENNLVDQLESYIKHSIISILRVPGGKLAQVLLGSQPQLLESRSEPYVFADPLFSFVPKTPAEKFYDASEPFIACGSLKRVFPTTGFAFVSYNNGKLEILEPKAEGPRLITSGTHQVIAEPVNTGFINFTLPSQSTKERIRKENPKATQDEIDFISATTSDNLPIGIQIYLTYQITNLNLALQKLVTIENLVSHIESRAISVMCTVIQGTKSNQLFVSSNYTAAHNDKTEDKSEADEANQSLPVYSPVDPKSLIIKPPPAVPIQPSAPSYSSIIQSAQHELTLDFEKIGVRLDRITLEKYKTLNPQVAERMAQQAIELADVLGKANRGAQEFIIKQAEAEREAMASRLKKEQENLNIVTTAQAEAEALGIRTTAKITAEGQLAEFYQSHPIMQALAQMQIQADALKGANVFISGSDVPVGAALNPQTFFNQRLLLQAAVVNGAGASSTHQTPEEGTKHSVTPT